MKRLFVALALASFSVGAWALDKPVPVQLLLYADFAEGSITGSQNEQSRYSIPAGYSSLRLTYISCETFSVAESKFRIFLTTRAGYPTISLPLNLIDLIPDQTFTVVGEVWQVASAQMDAYLGITSPGGPNIGRTVDLIARRDSSAGHASVACAVTGELN